MERELETQGEAVDGSDLVGLLVFVVGAGVAFLLAVGLLTMRDRLRDGPAPERGGPVRVALAVWALLSVALGTGLGVRKVNAVQAVGGSRQEATAAFLQAAGPYWAALVACVVGYLIIARLEQLVGGLARPTGPPPPGTGERSVARHDSWS